MGFGPGMKNSDLNVGVMQNKTNYRIHDIWSLGYGRPQDDTERGGTMDLTNVTYIPKSTFGSLYKITYNRKFNTDDVNDFIVEKVTFNPLYIQFLITN